MNVSRRKTAIIFPFGMFLKQKIYHKILYNLQNSTNSKFPEKYFKNLPKTGKTAEVFFLRRRFHLMRQSELIVRANTQF